MILEKRFWPKILMVGPRECWLWQAGFFNTGYGRFWNDGKRKLAHRIAFELWWGVSLPSSLDVCHNCPGGDNRACCNPAHLLIGDAKWHAEDKVAKGQMASGKKHGDKMRERAARGEQAGSAKLNEAQVKEILARFLQGASRSQLAREFKVSWNAIYDIVREKTWRHLQP